MINYFIDSYYSNCNQTIILLPKVLLTYTRHYYLLARENIEDPIQILKKTFFLAKLCILLLCESYFSNLLLFFKFILVVRHLLFSNASFFGFLRWLKQKQVMARNSGVLFSASSCVVHTTEAVPINYPYMLPMASYLIENEDKNWDRTISQSIIQQLNHLIVQENNHLII